MKDYKLQKSLINILNSSSDKVALEFLRENIFALANKNIQRGELIYDLCAFRIVDFNAQKYY